MAQARFALILWLCLIFPTFAVSGAATKKPPKPAWSELSPAQQQVLAPLASEWDKMDSVRRRKWLGIAQRYPKMKPQEQQRLQQRMTDWVKLSPEERRAARERYQKLKKLPPDKRKQVRKQWEEYQQSLAPPPPVETPEPAVEPVPAPGASTPGGT